ncbi:MAG: DCC1-like thiol-disulfide oxidoreductase family protein [Acidobacteriota bacterium]|nr:DCC1-like thiol-disulfide oxidoreductase family protein [Acidobacteriota bacterium]
MQIIALDDEERLYLSPKIDDWEPIDALGITVVIDVDGALDIGVAETPDHLLYIYFPIEDDGLPNLEKLHGIARLAADMVRHGHRVLSHCCMGFNRSALVAGLILMQLGISGEEAVALLRRKRPGALFNPIFAAYLLSLPPAAAVMIGPRAVVLFDGYCNLCSGSVQFVLRRDPHGHFHFASLQSPAGERLLAAAGFPKGETGTIVLVEGGTGSTRSEAVLRIARGLRQPWPLLSSILRLVPRPLRDHLYTLIANRRYAWFGRRDSCMLPTPEVRQRFLDS